MDEQTVRWERIRPLMAGDKCYYTDEDGNKFNAYFTAYVPMGWVEITLYPFGITLTVEQKWVSRGWFNGKKVNKTCKKQLTTKRKRSKIKE